MPTERQQVDIVPTFEHYHELIINGVQIQNVYNMGSLTENEFPFICNGIENGKHWNIGMWLMEVSSNLT